MWPANAEDGASTPLDSPDPKKNKAKGRHSLVEQYYSDSDRTRSISPVGKIRSMTNVTRINDLLNDTETPSPPVRVRGKPGPKPGGGDKNGPRNILKQKHMHIDPITGSLVTTRSILPSHPPPLLAEKTPKARSLTAHQVAIAENRKEKTDHLIEKKLKKLDHKNGRKRKREGIFARTWKRIKDMEDPFANSDEEGGDGDNSSGIRFDAAGNLILLDHVTKDAHTLTTTDGAGDEGVRLNVIEANAQLSHTPVHIERRRGVQKFQPLKAKYVNGTSSRGCAGLVPRDDEEDDYGEEAIARAAAIRRTQRRLDRWEEIERMRAAGVIPFRERGDDNGSTNEPEVKAEVVTKNGVEERDHVMEDYENHSGMREVDKDVNMSEDE